MLHEVAKVFLTNDIIAKAKCPTGKDQIIYWDHPSSIDGKVHNGSQSGLGFRITALGAKSFVHTYYFNGKRRRETIGQADRISLNSARLLVQTRNEKIIEGKDPSEGKIDYRKKHALTLRDVIDKYFELHLNSVSDKHRNNFARLIAPWHSPISTHNTQRGYNSKKSFDAFAPKLEDVPADSITPLQVDAFLKTIHSDSVANSALKHITALYNWANKMQLIDVRNPCTPISKRKIIKRKPEYTPEDVALIAGYIFNPALEALEIQAETAPQEKKLAALARGSLHVQNAQMIELCNFMGILMLTMARPAELKSALFEHFDLERLIWRKHNTKGIKLSKATYEYEYRSVPIHPRVGEIIQKQKDRWPDAQHVFPSHTDVTKERDNFQTAMKRFKRLKDVPEHFQMYDVKRMAISLMISGQDVRRDALSHYVDHKGNLETTLIYDLGFVDPMQPVTQKLGELLGV